MEKTHFQGCRRGDHGGAFVGVFQWGGRLLAYMAGRRGGVRYDYGAFFTSKNAIFLFGHSSEHDK